MRRLVSLPLVALALGCGTHRAETAATSAVHATNLFAADLYEQLSADTDNLVFSPLSIHTALSMTAAGARSETEAQMWRVLRNPEDRRLAHASLGTLLRANNRQSSETLLRVLNRVYAEESFALQDGFLQLLNEQYQAPPMRADFFGGAPRVTSEINEWVSRSTEGRIPNLIPAGALHQCTRLVLVNAVYFLGRWIRPFQANATRPETFHVGQREATMVPTMVQVGTHRYREHGGAQILEMSYLDGQTSMVVVLPKEREGLADLESRILDDGFSEFATTDEQTRVEVHLPKFQFTMHSNVVLALKRLGMTAAFDGTSADFSGIGAPTRPDQCLKRLKIDDIFHMAFVAVDEAGTEAAAATAVVAAQQISAGPPAPEPILFRADHPFLFVLKDRAGATLFVGRVNDPRG